jgi:hypothetical protein
MLGLRDGEVRTLVLKIEDDGRIYVPFSVESGWDDSGLRVDFGTMTVSRVDANPAHSPVLRDLGELADWIANIFATCTVETTYTDASKLAVEFIRKCHVAENEELAKEKKRRIKWQCFVYHAMGRIDKALDRKLCEGTGTTEANFKQSCDELCDEFAKLRAEVERMRLAAEQSK